MESQFIETELDRFIKIREQLESYYQNVIQDVFNSYDKRLKIRYFSTSFMSVHFDDSDFAFTISVRPCKNKDSDREFDINVVVPPFDFCISERKEFDRYVFYTKYISELFSSNTVKQLLYDIMAEYNNKFKEFSKRIQEYHELIDD